MIDDVVLMILFSLIYSSLFSWCFMEMAEGMRGVQEAKRVSETEEVRKWIPFLGTKVNEVQFTLIF